MNTQYFYCMGWLCWFTCMVTKRCQHVDFITICITFSVVPNGLNHGLWIFALMYLILNASINVTKCRYFSLSCGDLAGKCKSWKRHKEVPWGWVRRAEARASTYSHFQNYRVQPQLGLQLCCINNRKHHETLHVQNMMTKSTLPVSTVLSFQVIELRFL